MATDRLAEYRRKRDFSRTPEPDAGAAPGTGGRPRFAVQRHAARRLHHDFRLEIGGTLASWAVTKTPSLDPAIKRLAMRTEDHPLSYGSFEGVIPAGEYGGGTVMLWDEGWFEPIGDPVEGLAAGKLHVILHGERMRGEWLLVRTRGRPGERGEPWLLRKQPDAEAGATDALEREVTSVTTGRSLEEIARGAPAAEVREMAKGVPPFRPVALAQLVARAPEGPDWVHEIKHDGYRALVAIGDGEARVFTRSGLDWTDRFPGVAAEARGLKVRRALLDGELVAQDSEGRSRFGLLQEALSAGDSSGVRYIAFDLLELDGEDLAGLPLSERKARLKPLIPGRGVIGYSDDHAGSGAAILAGACALGLEGIVSKRTDARYVGKRTGDWLKVKCTARETLLVVGWLPSEKGRGFRSLLLGRREGKSLVYAGKVGTGFTVAGQAALMARLEPLKVEPPTVEAPRAAVRGATWVRPELAGEVAYAEVTNDGVLRHASWLGPVAGFAGGAKTKPGKASAKAGAGGAAPPASKTRKAADRAADRAAEKAPTGLPGITHPDRLIFPEAGITKGELADYYVRMAGPVLATAGNRYLSLVRCPEGRQKACFFQKHAGDGFDGVHSSDPGAKGKRWLYIDDAVGLLRCVQMGTIEFHGWGSPADRPGFPDRLVIDLDPDEGLDFSRSVEGAVEMRDQLAGLGLVSFALLSGGKGLHVVAPLDGSADWARVKDFARRFAHAMAAAHPERYTAELAKAKRHGRIFIDWLRNQEGATAVMPWTVRARPGAPVATPVGWDELRRLSVPQPFSIRDVDALLTRAAAMADWGRHRQRLPDA